MQAVGNEADREPATISWQVKFFLVFSAAASALALTIFVRGLEWLSEATVPFTGWGVAMPYLFTLGSWPRLFQGRNHVIDIRALRHYLTGACVLLVLATAFGIVDFYQFGDLRDETSPWLRYHPLRPLWTVVLPIVWCAVLWRERKKIARGAISAPAPRREPIKKSTFFFAISWLSVMVWGAEAYYYWIHNHRTNWSRGLLVVLAITGITSLLAGIFVRSFTEDTPV